MRVMVSLENRFYRARDGKIYSNNIFDYNIWQQYLKVFDEVIILARLGNTDDDPGINRAPASGPGVRFFDLPMFIGPWQYLKVRHEIKKRIKSALKEADVFILRIPGNISALLWHELRKANIPYAVEVVGSSKDSLKTCGANILFRSVLNIKNKILDAQKNQCKYASAARYITKNYLQNEYPPGGWSISCSNILLTQETLIDEAGLEKRFESLMEAFTGKRAFRICHVGTMSALYKGQDILINAVSICRQKGMDIELTFLGDGRCRKYFEQKAIEFGIENHVHFLGNLPPGNSVRQELDKADLFVFPSLTEGQGRALLEAMARGLPCIGAKVGGIIELLEEKFLVAPGSAAALAERIESVLKDLDKLKQASRRNLKEAAQYQYSFVSEKRNQFYRKVIELCSSKVK